MDEGTDELDIDTLDFFSDPNYRVTILEREQRRCFYTLVELNEDNFVIDHVVATSQGPVDVRCPASAMFWLCPVESVRFP